MAEKYDKKHLYSLVVLTALGLGFMGVWMNLVGYSTAFAPVSITEEIQALVEYSRYSFYSGIVLCGLVYMVLGNRIDVKKQYLDVIICFLMCFGTSAFGIAYQQTMFPAPLLASLGCLFSGFGYSWIVISLYLILAKRATLRVAVLAIAVSLVFETVCALFLNMTLPDSVQIVIGILMPILATSVIVRGHFAKSKEDIRPLELHKLSGKDENFQILMVILASFGLLVIRGITTVGLWGGVRSDYSTNPFLHITETLGACILFLLLAYITLARKAENPLYSRYQSALLVLVVGFVIFLVSKLAFTITEEVSLARILVQAIELFGHLLNWVIAIATVQLLRFSKYRVFAFGLLLYNGLAMVWMAFLENVSDLVTTCVLMTIFAIVFCMATIPVNIGRDKKEPLRDSCAQIAQEKGLTAREGEVLALLAVGRSRPYIQKKLVLAAGTVKTHSSNIYRKIGVHSRQELLDLIEDLESKN